MTVIANARQTVAAPTRTARRFGLLSVADVVDGGEQHWMLGGLTADGEECSEPEEGDILCGPSPNKASRSWYSDIDADPWLAYMFETCKTVGRFSEASAKLRNRFLAAEQSAVEAGFQKHVLSSAYSWGEQPSVAAAIGKLEQEAGEAYGGQIILHLPFLVAEEASHAGMFERVGDHIETVAGNLVSIGNYRPDLNGGSNSAPVLYATGGIVLYRGSLVEAGPVFDSATNDYFALAERAYVGLVDCFAASASAPICGCSGGGGGSSGVTQPRTLAPGDQINLTGAVGARDCQNVLDYLNGGGGTWPANPTTAWPGGWTDPETVLVVTGDIPTDNCAVKWDGSAWMAII